MRSEKGFTLVEIIVVLVLVAIIAVIAVPAMQSISASNSLNATSGDLTSALGAARMQALSMRADVVVTPAAGGWGDGWTVDYPAASNEEDKTFVPANGVTVSREDGAGALTFSGQGGVVGGGATFSVCSADEDVNGYTLTLTFLGKVAQTIKGDCP